MRASGYAVFLRSDVDSTQFMVVLQVIQGRIEIIDASDCHIVEGRHYSKHCRLSMTVQLRDGLCAVDVGLNLLVGWHAVAVESRAGHDVCDLGEGLGIVQERVGGDGVLPSRL